MQALGYGKLGLIRKCKLVPDASKTLISISQLTTDADCNIIFEPNEARVYHDGILLTTARKQNGLYEIKLSDLGYIQDQCNLASTSSGSSISLAHRRLTHASIGLIQKALKLNLVKGITISKSDLSSPQLPEGLCDGCAQGKAHRRKHRRETRQMIPTKTRRSQELGGLIAVDFTGPFSPPAIVTGNTVVFGATDAASRYSWTFYGKHRTEDFVIECIQKIVDYLHSKGKRLIHYHADGGRELVSHRVLNLLRKLGSTWTFNAPYTPEDNPIQERPWRTTKERTLASICNSGLPPNFWEQAMSTVTHMKNRLPCATAKGFISPYQFIHDEAPDLSYARIWGCKCHTFIDKSQRRNDWSPHSHIGYFMGYREDGPGYVIYVPSLKDFVISSHVFFNECIPDVKENYYAEIESSLREENSENRTTESFQYLVGMTHTDPQDGLQYITTRITVIKGHVAAYRGLAPRENEGRVIELNDPIHAADIERYTAEHFSYQNAVSPPQEEPGCPVEGTAPGRSSSTDSRHDATRGGSHSHLRGPYSNEKEARPRRTAEAQRNTVPKEARGDNKCDHPARKVKRAIKTVNSQGDRSRQSPDGTITGVRTPHRHKVSRCVKKSLHSKRQTRKRVIMNVHKFGDNIYHCDVDKRYLYNHKTPDKHDSYRTLYMNDVDIIMHANDTCSNDVPNTPNNVGEALSGRYKEQWLKAINKEIKSLESKGCWRITTPPANSNIIRGKFVFRVKVKRDEVTFKARLVAQGFSQVEGKDYNETYSPVAKATSMRTVIALATILGLELHQVDFSTAYINADLQEEIYMYPPAGLNVPNGKVLRLLKSIYGLKQSGLNWYKCCTNYLLDCGFTRLVSDPCIFTKSINGRPIILAVYVDDIIIAGKSRTDIIQIKNSLAEKFDIHDLGLLDYYLGIFVKQDIQNRTTTLNQSQYIRNLLHRFNMEDCKPRSHPMTTNFHIDILEKKQLSQENQEFVQNFPYKELIGSLMYIAVCTRPDIAYAVNTLARFSTNPNLTTCKAALNILRYLKGTIDQGLQYSGKSVTLTGFADSDWARCNLTRRSTTAFCFFIGNCLISWQSRLQTTVALSSTEAEYMALSTACQEAIWLRSLLSELGFHMPYSTTIWCDNKGAIQLCLNPVHHRRTKHIAIRYHFIREQVASHSIIVDYMPTNEMLADILTKPLTSNTFHRLRDSLMGGGGINIPASNKRTKVSIPPAENSTKRPRWMT